MLLKHRELIVYRNMEHADILNDICDLLEVYHGGEDIPCLTGKVADAFGRLIEYCRENGYRGDLWSVYLTSLLVNAENSYSYSCEAGGTAEADDILLHDMKIFAGLFKLDIDGLITESDLTGLRIIRDYSGTDLRATYDPWIRDLVLELADELKNAETPEIMADKLGAFHIKYGVGVIGLHRAFRLDTDDGLKIVPIPRMSHFTLDDLIGYESAKQKLTENTEAFLNKKPANNCLLYGDAGTGKSSCIRALATEYYERGLRIIQVCRDQYRYLIPLISMIRNRNYRFIIYMDDLSFEDFETDYKYLKAIIEGGIEERPDNILIYATSNRRHLIRESVSDRDDRDEDMHRSDTMAEKISLSQRFGVSIYFGSPMKKEFNSIVLGIAKKSGLDMPEDELLAEANKWELSHGGLSGRTARQFIDHLLGTMPERSAQ